MAPRKRLRRNVDLPPNLYSNKVGAVTYYRYRRPDTGTFHSLGTVKGAAIADARQLNAILMKPADRVGRVMGTAEQTMSHLIGRYRKEFLPGQGLADSTVQLIGYRLNRFEKDLGEQVVESFDVKACAEYLDDNFQRDSYIKHRTTLVDLFRFAQMKGLYPADLPNPAAATYPKAGYEKQRQRLTLDGFKAIYAAAPEWLQIAMQLALVTLQGRTEVINMQFSEFDEKAGALKVVRQKVQKHEHAYLIIESPRLASIISRARRSGIVSPFIVHRVPERRNKAKGRQHWSQLTANHFSAEFRLVRDETGLFDDMPREERPTFHEVRALGSWLYKKQGFDKKNYVRPLMAHADEKMTDEYQKGHEQEWVRVKAELDVSEIFG
ncbi:phage integrase Arm DNA-binding domain-containing protein [Marinobacter sp.]|uniref:phage integrase Arm DNA-binding domain-containing protein n=1 Tax=Marinobacter sp. TaxID=50741 RepID=UPI0035C72544